MLNIMNGSPVQTYRQEKSMSEQQRHVEKIVEDARNALLAHFSAKSTAQTAVLVGLAVTLFADFQAYSALRLPYAWQRITFLTFTLGAIIFFILHAIGRLMFYGELATQVTDADLELDDLHHTYMARLGRFSLDHVEDHILFLDEEKTKKRWSVDSIVWRTTLNVYFKVFYLGLLLLAFFLLLLLLKAPIIF
jgi:uncharacterized membrane protein